MNSLTRERERKSIKSRQEQVMNEKKRIKLINMKIIKVISISLIARANRE